LDWHRAALRDSPRPDELIVRPHFTSRRKPSLNPLESVPYLDSFIEKMVLRGGTSHLAHYDVNLSRRRIIFALIAHSPCFRPCVPCPIECDVGGSRLISWDDETDTGSHWCIVVLRGSELDSLLFIPTSNFPSSGANHGQRLGVCRVLFFFIHLKPSQIPQFELC